MKHSVSHTSTVNQCKNSNYPQIRVSEGQCSANLTRNRLILFLLSNLKINIRVIVHFGYNWKYFSRISSGKSACCFTTPDGYAVYITYTLFNFFRICMYHVFIFYLLYQAFKLQEGSTRATCRKVWTPQRQKREDFLTGYRNFSTRVWFRKS